MRETIFDLFSRGTFCLRSRFLRNVYRYFYANLERYFVAGKNYFLVRTIRDKLNVVLKNFARISNNIICSV